MSYRKRLNTPRSWSILRKENKYIVSPSPTGFPIEYSLPITLILKNLGFATTTNEVKYFLRNNVITVNGTRVTEYQYSVGLFDVLTLRSSNGLSIFQYRIGFLNKKLHPYTIPEDEVDLRFCYCLDKRIISGQRYQINFFFGKNLLVNKEQFDSISRNNLVVFNSTTNEIVSIEKMSKGSLVFKPGKSSIHTIESIVRPEYPYRGNRLLTTEGITFPQKNVFIVPPGTEVIQ